MAWNATWREAALPELAAREWDLIVVGGGISGAGILREAARRGWRCLLLEQRDFAWGTSSRSSKMVHGGLRYLAKGQLRLARDAVRERQQLLGELPGLVEPLPFLFPHERGRFPGPRLFGGLLGLYDALAGQRRHRYHPAGELPFLAPGLTGPALRGASHFGDAITDDARLVLRVLQEARADGGEALNGVRVVERLHEQGRVVGVLAEDRESGQRLSLRSRMLALATGAWSDELRDNDGTSHIRPLRGSHLLLPAWRLPVAQALSVRHAQDGRPVFVFPWEGATVIGTTDLDHDQPLAHEPRISPAETDYLLAACAQVLPEAGVGRADILSTWAGVRPVVGAVSGPRRKPSDEPREHALWSEPGCVTLAGGKLTTFRPLALEVLRACARQRDETLQSRDEPLFRPAPEVTLPGLCASQQRRLRGRHGHNLPRLAELLASLGSERVGATPTLWAELALACEDELVLHLDDLLLRRTRLGLLLPRGGDALLPRIRALCQPLLGWSDARWLREEQAYRQLWQRCYSPGEAS